MAISIGRTKGGRNTEVYTVCDEKGRPHVLPLSPGNTYDVKVARLCVEAMSQSAELVGN